MTDGPLDFEVARRCCVGAAMLLEGEWVPLDAALDRVLVAPLRARWPLPVCDHAAMDGFALRSSDIGDASDERPVVLPIVGEVAAGQQPLALPKRAALRISTGARVPEGVDCVLRREDARLHEEALVVNAPIVGGTHVRRRGEDLAQDQVLAEAGARIDPDLVLALATFGHDPVYVRRAPRVTVVTCGDELVEVAASAPDRVVDSAGPTLAAACRDLGALAQRVGPLPDDPTQLRDRIGAWLSERPDLLITVGGASVGDHDHLRAVLEALGVRWVFTRIHVKPGKPTSLGVVAGVPVVMLPGNPGAARVVFDLCVVPMLAAMLGIAPRPARSIIVNRGLERDTSRTSLMQARVVERGGALVVDAMLGVATSQLEPRLAANAVVVVPPGPAPLPAGSALELAMRRPIPHQHVPTLGFIGSSNSGKTTLVSRLIARLAGRLTIGVIKHGRHFELDRPGKDSDRFRSAGARFVALASSELHATLSWPDHPPTLAELQARLAPELDAVFVEGFKHARELPAIEVHRAGRPLLCQREGIAEVLAVVSDAPHEVPDSLPCFGHDDLDAIEGFVLSELERQRGA